mmetsp:Transcript_29337/g.42569  ORF Transcript_29337/g.42569 Transcript_29337/m.42569 type:complete len:95 (-) Transcript_29337:14-298(-)
MNAAFLASANETRQKLPKLTHNQEVARLYRHALKTLSSWAIDRDIFNEEADAMRARFDAAKGCSPAMATRLLKVCGSAMSFVCLSFFFPTHLAP